MSSNQGQKLIKIPGRSHWYYDSKTKKIYFFRNTVHEYMKFSIDLEYDETPSCLLKASRLISKREKEEREKKKLKPKSIQLNKLLGEYIDDMVDRESHFHKSKKSPVAAQTMKGYQTSVNLLKPYFQAMLPSELIPDPKDFEAAGLKFEEPWLKFVAHIQQQHPGLNMFNLTKHFRALCKYLHENGVLQKRPKIFNPFAQKEKVIRRKKAYRIYTPEEILLMDSVCNADQRLALWFGYGEGFRTDDCVELTWDRIDLGPLPHIVFHGDDNKAKFVGTIPLSDTTARLLRERRKTTVSPWVFHQASNPDLPMNARTFHFEEVVRDSGVRYGSHKTLRHTRLTEDFGNPNLDNALVMKIRRVSYQVAIEHYIHPTDADFEKFRNSGKAKKDFGGET